MLSVDIDKIKEGFKICFDVPLPRQAQAHSEFRKFKDTIINFSLAEFEYSNGALNGLFLTFQGWLSFTQRYFSKSELLFQQKLLEILVKTDLCKKECLNINFHQKNFDTDYRYWDFILNQGNFIEYFYNRFNWYLLPYSSVVSDFPLHVDLESSNECNMSCPMCYRELMKKRGFMDWGLFKKAIDECAENNVFSVRLSWRGETLTHPHINEMIAYASKKIKNVSFLTNAFFITPEKIDCFIENKLSYIAVSFDGIGKTYESIRWPAKFNQNFEILAELKKRREQLHSKLPQIRLCTIWPAVKDNPKAYYDTMLEVSDYIVSNPYINFKGPIDKKPIFICQYPWQRIVVGFDGETQCCTGWNAEDIILGNIKESSIKDMWQSKSMQRIRSMHAENKRMDIPACANCRHGATQDAGINIADIINRRY